jgi:hypothetical protein
MSPNSGGRPVLTGAWAGGLRVVDASVMPEVIRANTTCTTIMIAERVADWSQAGTSPQWLGPRR